MIQNYKRDIVDIDLDTGTVFRSFLNRTIGMGDDEADRFGVRTYRNGQPASLVGAQCLGFFRDPMGNNIVLNGFIGSSGNVAYVVLGQECYQYEGPFTLAIKVIGDNHTATLRIVDGVVSNTNTENPVAPLGSVPTYQEVLATYQDMLDALDELGDQTEHELTSRFEFTANRRINALNGDYQSDGDLFQYMKATQGYANISGYDFLRITMMTHPGGNRAGLAFYSAESESSFISGVESPDMVGVDSYVSFPVEIPAGANFIRTTYWSDSVREAQGAPEFSCFGVTGYRYDYQEYLGEENKVNKPFTYERNIKFFVDNYAGADLDGNTGVDGQTIFSTALAGYLDGTGNKVTDSDALSVWIRLEEGTKQVMIQGHATNHTAACLMTDNSTTTPAYATGYNRPVTIRGGNTGLLHVPDDAKFLYLSLYGADGEERKPVNIGFLVSDSKNPKLRHDLITREIHLDGFELTEANYKTNRYIHFSDLNRTHTTWTSGADTASYVVPLDGAKQVYMLANSENPSVVCFLTSKSTAIGVPDYATGYAHQMDVPAGTRVELDVPDDATHMYFRIDGDRGPFFVRFRVPRNRVSRKKPLFCFVDDDAKADALTWLEGVVDATRIPINIALITGPVEAQSSTFISWDDVRRLRNKGFCFVNHTNGTVPLTTLTLAEVEDSFKESQRLMEEHGLQDSNILVLPNGATNDDIDEIIKDYFTCSLSTQKRINLPPINTFYIPRITLDTNVDGEPAYVSKIAEWKDWVDKTISINGLCIFYGHAYRADYTAQKRVDYIELVKYIAQNGGEIVSLPEAIKRYGNVIEGDVTVGCDEIGG